MITNSSNRYLKKTDWVSVILFLLLAIVGLLSVNSASYDASHSVDFYHRFTRQLVWVVVSIGVGYTILRLDKLIIFKLTIPLYIASIVIALLLLIVGKEVNGAKSWLEVGPISIQPVEFGKIATALMLARIFISYDASISKFMLMLKAISVILIPVALIILQNDTGSALVFMGLFIVLFICGFNLWFYITAISMILLFVFGLMFEPYIIEWLLMIFMISVQAIQNRNKLDSLRYFALLVGCHLILMLIGWWFDWEISFNYYTYSAVLLTLPVVIVYAIHRKLKNIFSHFAALIASVGFVAVVEFFFTNMLQVYQQKRILSMLGLESDPKGWGYNVNQSLIAIGSGGVWGKGYMNGTQTKYNFVPEQATDFIFCTIGEEGGFIVSILLLGLFTALVFRLLRLAEKINDNFARVYTFGVVAIITVHVFVNICMTLGLMPVIGIPLPFISYGGSSFLGFTILVFTAIRLCVEEKVTRVYN